MADDGRQMPVVGSEQEQGAGSASGLGRPADGKDSIPRPDPIALVTTLHSRRLPPTACSHCS